MTHLYFAKRWCEIFNVTDLQVKKEFVLGNLFPDIRYIAHIPREWTHEFVYSPEEIHAASSPFEAGMKLHAFVDEVREELVEATGIYAFVLPYAAGHEATLLKFVEEEILAEFFDGRSFSYCLKSILEEELRFGLDINVVQRWHGILGRCMQAKPSWLLWFASQKGSLFGIPASTLNEWSYLLPELAKQPVFRDHVQRLLLHMENQLLGGGIVVY